MEGISGGWEPWKEEKGIQGSKRINRTTWAQACAHLVIFRFIVLKYSLWFSWPPIYLDARGSILWLTFVRCFGLILRFRIKSQILGLALWSGSCPPSCSSPGCQTPCGFGVFRPVTPHAGTLCLPPPPQPLGCSQVRCLSSRLLESGWGWYTWSCHIAVQPWRNYSASLGVCFYIYKMAVIVPVS